MPPLPLLEYFDQRDVVLGFYERRRRAGARVVEPGRLALSPEVRSGALARFLIAGTFAWIVEQGIREAIVTCQPSLAKFYFRFCFEPVPGTVLGEVEGHGIPAWCLWGRADALSEKVLPLVDALRRGWRSAGETCYCPVFARCHGEPPADLLCPLRARAVLDPGG